MKSWVIGNWKLNPATIGDVTSLVNGLTQTLQSQTTVVKDCNIMLAPSFIHLSQVGSQLSEQGSDIQLACQDVTPLTATIGAYTGDISAAQLKDVGVNWAIIGHSERRQYYNETNSVLLSKMQHCFSEGLGVVFCIGELETDFMSGNTVKVLASQLAVIQEMRQQLESMSVSTDRLKLIVAYEPVWAIGTGKIPSVDEVSEVHIFIRQQLQSFDMTFSETPIIYGGSVKPDNAHDFAACKEINGVLVGGASLQATDFVAIASSFSQ